MLLLFLAFLGLSIGDDATEMKLDVPYTGAIGDEQQLLRFTPSKYPQTALFVVTLLPLTKGGLDGVQPVQLMIQDSRYRLFSYIEAPYFDDGVVVSERGTQILCSSDNVEWYLLIPTGRPGIRYQVTVKGLDRKLELGKRVSDVQVLNTGIPKWFYYDSDQDELPLFINLSSNSTSLARLYVFLVDCPVMKQVLVASSETGAGYLTFSTNATMVISRALMPYIARGRWFIGVEVLNATEHKFFSIDVTLGKTYRDYLLPIFLPPIAILLLIGLILTIAVLTTVALSKKVGIKVDPPRTSWGYFLLTFIIGVVFLIPGFQVVLNVLSKMESTGDRDLCFYNEACQRPAGAGVAWVAMNNIVSNVGYIIVGAGFIFYSYIVKWQSKVNRINVGLPRDGSIPYAMGVAIVMEGISSAVYHLCPSRIIFQFDTANMFIIVALGQAELFRRLFYHPSKTTIFTLLAGLLFMNYIGSITDTDKTSNRLYNSIWFFVIITMFFISFLFPYSLKDPDHQYFDFWGELFASSDFRKSLSRSRIWFLVVLYAVNSAIFWYINLGTSQADFATTFLGMLVVSQSMSVIAYEFNNRRSLSKSPPIYLAMKVILTVLFVGCWATAGWFFLQPTSDKALTPASSREENSNCILADFYDSHDVWHFASAIALLIMCLIFFHLDLNAHYKGKNIGERFRRDYYKLSVEERSLDEQEVAALDDEFLQDEPINEF
eukprot:TRINITY_DN6756_c0_g1_i1.p1 TRINITY_DN6756_c0_g1~~TRINITY_DN6756_c0_g1_i1.p1  ORF type:complete len:717 (+),score=75.40 TRINITY_DN6756_c0_g1_i1:11-2161(+)